MSSHCLVTGGSGFIGRYLVKSLLELGNTVTVLDRVESKLTETILSDINNENLKIGDHYIDTVYHLAGLAHRTALTPAESEAFFRVNKGGTCNLLHALETTVGLPEKVVMISTVAVYDLEHGEDIAENAPKQTTNPYGVSKIRAEEYLNLWALRFGVKATIIRLPLVLGVDAPGNFGAMVSGIRKHRYFGIGSGTARRSMVLAEDVCKALPFAAEIGGTYNVTDGYHPSFRELEGAISAALGIREPLKLPFHLAWGVAKICDLGTRFTGIRLPFNSNIMSKMTNTLTFNDRSARLAFNWRPRPVLEHIKEIVE